MHTLTHVLGTWGVVLTQLRRKSVCWQGIPLSDKDLYTFTEATVMCALLLTDMSLRFDGIGSEREIIAWAKSMVSWDVHVLGSFLSDAIVELRHVANPMTYNQFKRRLSKDYPLAGMFLSPIRTVLSSFLEDPNPRDFYPCYQFLSFLTHLSLSDLTIDMMGEYEELESSLHSLHYPPDLLVSLNGIMRDWMKDFSISEASFMPEHGPGATFELSKAACNLAKYQYLGTDALIDYVFSKYAGIDVATFFPFEPKRLIRKSTVVDVPKSMKTRRLISKEPASLMYLQKGVSRVLMDYVHHSPSLRNHIDFTDQEKNAQLAIRSSSDQKFATIDLSSASDRVTTRLVKAVFRGTPVLPYLLALRSQIAVLPDKELVMEKYAPMGSALCFPVQTLIFSCAVEFAVRRATRTHLGFFPAWRVYGDDIIVADALFPDVVMTLEALGFHINASKSYSSPSRFRESCGGEGFDGVDVTPMKISRRFYSPRGGITSYHAALFTRLVKMANDAYLNEFPLLRAWIIRVLLDNPVGPPLFSRDVDCALYSPQPDNYRAAFRWNSNAKALTISNYQRWEIQVAVGGPANTKKRFSDDPCIERARYFETLRLSSCRTGDMFDPTHRIDVSCGSAPYILRKRWVREDLSEV